MERDQASKFMFDLLRLDLTPERIAKLRSIAHIHGLPLDARSVTDELVTQEGKERTWPRHRLRNLPSRPTASA